MSRKRQNNPDVSDVETLKTSKRIEEWRSFFNQFKIQYGSQDITFTEDDFLKHPRFLTKLSELSGATRGRNIKRIFIINVASFNVLPELWKDVCLRDPGFLFHDISKRIQGIDDEARYFNKSLPDYKSFMLSNFCVLNTKSFSYIRGKLDTLASLWNKPIEYAKDFYLTNPGAVLQKAETVINKIELAYSLLPTNARPDNQLQLLDKYSRVASYSPEFMLANYLLWRLNVSEDYQGNETIRNGIFANIESKANELLGHGFEGKRFLICYGYLRKLAKTIRNKALTKSGTPAEKKVVFKMRDYIFKIAGRPEEEATDEVKNRIDDFLDKIIKRLAKKDKNIYNIELATGLKIGTLIEARDEYDKIIAYYMESLRPYEKAFGCFKKGDFMRLLSMIETIGIDDLDLQSQLKIDLARLMELLVTIQIGSIVPETDESS